MSGALPFLHLASGDSAAGAVRTALARLGREEEVISFRDALTVGPLTDVDTGAALRVAWWGRVGGKPLDAIDAAALDDSAIWTRIRGDRRRVVLWHGPHANERLYALRACWWLRDEPARVHEVRLDVRSPIGAGRPLPPFYGAIAIVGPDPLATAWEKCVVVTNVDARAAHWEQVRRIGFASSMAMRSPTCPRMPTTRS